MRPILFDFFGFGVPSYSVAMVLGFAVALWVLFRLTPRGPAASEGGLERGQVWDLFIVMVVSSVLGSKIGHTLFEAPGHVGPDGEKISSFAELIVVDPLHWARLGEAGYVWYGGMIGALAVATFYFWRRPHLNAWLYSDLFAPAIMAGAAVGRLGCFFAGCCYGQPTDSPLGVQFPKTSSPVHPTQLYDSTIAFVLAVVLYLNFRRRRFEGQNIALLLIAYPILRSLTEAVRGDADRGSIGPLSTSQAISLPLLLVGLGMYIVQYRRAKRAAT